MEATRILMDEHRVIERVLGALEAAAARMSSGAPVRAEFFLQTADFIAGFADGCHHRKEEGVLFPALEAAGIPRAGGPVGVMLAEHEEARAITRSLRAAAERMVAGDGSAATEARRKALEYAALLRQHIMKEDRVLFPMADSAIEGRELVAVTAEFARLQREETADGVQAKYRALAGALEREARG
jgi:hemerythrin-like domain-containing protein